MGDEVTDEDLELVARHGRGQVERALAVVCLAQRRGRADELEELVEDALDTNAVATRNDTE